MAPLLLAAIQAVASKKQQEDQEKQAKIQAATRSQAMQYPGAQGGGQSNALGLLSSFAGASGGKQGDAMSAVDDAIGSYDNHKQQDDEDHELSDYFGGIR